MLNQCFQWVTGGEVRHILVTREVWRWWGDPAPLTLNTTLLIYQPDWDSPASPLLQHKHKYLIILMDAALDPCNSLHHHLNSGLSYCETVTISVIDSCLFIDLTAGAGTPEWGRQGNLTHTTAAAPVRFSRLEITNFLLQTIFLHQNQAETCSTDPVTAGFAEWVNTLLGAALENRNWWKIMIVYRIE